MYAVFLSSAEHTYAVQPVARRLGFVPHPNLRGLLPSRLRITSNAGNMSHAGDGEGTAAEPSKGAKDPLIVYVMPGKPKPLP